MEVETISNFQLLTFILIYIFVNCIVFYALDHHSLVQLLNILTSIFFTAEIIHLQHPVHKCMNISLNIPLKCFLDMKILGETLMLLKTSDRAAD